MNFLMSIGGLLAIITVILSLGVGIFLILTSGPRKTFEEELKEMAEDGYKTYRR
uniref:Uncharacterized protein n=1 Tax=Pseudomonas phage Arace01 TaxID=3138526 RepID=A0AAU6W079_9VIRU